MKLLILSLILLLQFANSIWTTETISEMIRTLENRVPVPARPNYSEDLGNADVGELPATVNRDAYRKSLGLEDNPKKAKAAFEFIVSTRQFEIELYWKRATYFWTFIAAVFVAYVALRQLGEKYVLETLVVSAVGIILSLAWHFSNLGSKSWQRHWEKHLDLIEDGFMGPLYKTVNVDKTYSVSKINEIVSFTFVVVWITLFCRVVQSSYNFTISSKDIDWGHTLLIISICTALCLVLCSMVFGKGRGRFKAQNIKMYRRNYNFD